MLLTPIWRSSSSPVTEVSSARCRRSPPLAINFSVSVDDDLLPDKKDSPPQFMRRISFPNNDSYSFSMRHMVVAVVLCSTLVCSISYLSFSSVTVPITESSNVHPNDMTTSVMRQTPQNTRIIPEMSRGLSEKAAPYEFVDGGGIRFVSLLKRNRLTQVRQIETPKEGSTKNSENATRDVATDHIDKDTQREFSLGKIVGKQIRKASSDGAIAKVKVTGNKSLVIPIETAKNKVKRHEKFTISKITKIKHERFVRKYARYLRSDYTPRGPPGKIQWQWHSPDRSDRFPSVQERIEYYMGKWYNKSNVKMYGNDFRRAMYEYRRTTRQYDDKSSVLVNLFDLDPGRFLKCAANSHYCRDFVNLAIIHSEGSANVVQHIGDGVPQKRQDTDTQFPLFSKVRYACDKRDPVTGKFMNLACNSDVVSGILWPLNRRRHFFRPADIPDKDTPWDEKKSVAVWRGASHLSKTWRYKEDMPLMNTVAMRWRAVSKHANSSLVDAKYTFPEKYIKYDYIPSEYCATDEMSLSQQLKYKYLIAIEGNDVSSGLKWMLFSNSVVLMPPVQFESWAMESLLEPYVHFIPIKPDFSDLEKQIQWAEDNPDKTQTIAQRSTLFIYDLLFHPDALADENRVLEGIMERYEENFGLLGSERELHPVRHIHPDWHPRHRSERFPSKDERVKYYMGKWFSGSKASMKRSSFSHPELTTNVTDQKVELNKEMIVSGFQMETCASSGDELKAYCVDVLPDFDERVTTDLSHRSKLKIDQTHRLAKKSSLRANNRHTVIKEFKRILFDDSIKVVRFGDSVTKKEWTDVPVFVKARHSGNPGASILWDFEYDREFSFIFSGSVEKVDTPFMSKAPRAIWRGGYGTSQIIGDPLDNEELRRRYEMVQMSLTNSSTFVDAKFLVRKGDTLLDEKQRNELQPSESTQVELSVDEDFNDESHISKMLSYRYIVATEDDFRINSDLKWMLLSQSVVLMPRELRFTSWFMEDLLEPYVHFIPIESDYSNIVEQVQWCESNLKDARRISERATLFVHDMIFHRSSDFDNSEVKFQMMDRYKDRFDH